jgi:hypothetical protein
MNYFGANSLKSPHSGIQSPNGGIEYRERTRRETKNFFIVSLEVTLP